MDQTRAINTRFWEDNYIIDLDPIEKLLFMYFLTNNHTHICGIYEIPLRLIALETGIDKEMILKILQRFEKDGKIFYIDGYIVIKNFLKHQKLNPNMKIAVEKGFKNVPAEIWLKIKTFKTLREWFKTILKGYLTLSNGMLKGKGKGKGKEKEKEKEKYIAVATKVAPATQISFSKQIQNYFTEKYKQKFGSEPMVDFGKDQKVVNKARDLFTGQEWQKLIDGFLESQKARDMGYTLAICFSTHTINLWKANKLDKILQTEF